MSEDLIHKRRPATNGGRGRPQSLCGRYGYLTLLWRKVNCPVCLKARKS